MISNFNTILQNALDESITLINRESALLDRKNITNKYNYAYVNYSDTVVEIMSDFHDTISENRILFRKWFAQSFNLNPSKISMYEFIDIEEVQIEDFMKLYWERLSNDFKDQILMECFIDDVRENQNIYPESTLKFVDNSHLFRFMSEFVKNN